ncbi:helix-turn-helix domain-containing protein [Nocardioides sp. T2.26MG-1]|uniref:helix-turn-helix domain-containing protein n=1 Tax=Nocardioides sp. T2.26MG-1 TaxID=3041166 RepID=UPI00253F99BE|nr:helix-turn-helix domain-containing protein [Nocardioides sp. T2.26MG-1]
MTPLIKSGPAAQYLDVSVDYLYRLVREGKVPARRVGRGLRFDPVELAAVGRTELAPVRTPAAVLAAGPASAPAAPAAARRKLRRDARPAASIREQLAALDPYAHMRRAS